MPNPFAVGQMNNNLAPMRDIYNAMKNAQNPMQVFSNIASRNPQMQPIMRLLNNGANPQQVFNELCKQRGINPDEFIRALTKY